MSQQGSTIQLDVQLDDQKVPEKIFWQAAEGGIVNPTEAKAFMLSIWDLNESACLRIDLWTKKMMVDEMNDFFFQTMMTMADTYERATNQKELAEEMRVFCLGFKTKMETEMKKNQL
jgi:gliding motility-associated protein GldC